MSKNQNDEQEERRDEETDARTLDQLEETEEAPSDQTQSPIPSPDRTSGRATEDDSGQPI